MKKRKVVSGENLPMRLPVHVTWLAALSQATWEVPGWLVGGMWTMIALLWLVSLVDIFNCDRRKIFSDKNTDG